MSTEKQLSYIKNMVEDLINENSESSQINFHEYLKEKTREIVLGEMCDDNDDNDMDDKDKDKKYKKDDEENEEDEDENKMSEGFAQPSEGSMSKKVKGNVKFKNGGKKTAKTLEKPAKVGKTEFKKGGKKTAKTLEKIPTPVKFSDGRDYGLGTT